MKNMGIKLIRLLMVLCLLLPAAATSEDDSPPQAVVSLCASIHPGYTILRHDGWGDDTRGQYVLILSKGGDNILCIAEKAQDDPAYALTIDNTHAVYDGDVLPSVLIDTGGDSLWYTYLDEQGRSAHYGSVKENGIWGMVSVIAYQRNDGGFSGMYAGIWDGALHYEETDEDENENVRSRREYPPIPVGTEFEEQMKLSRFDIEKLDLDPADGVCLPASSDEAAPMTDASVYALVHNPDPQDRLHLREKPDRGSVSLGKFYNCTPVRVLEQGDTWTKVCIGCGDNVLNGYMMTRYLAFDEADKAAVACAFPQLHLIDDKLQILTAPDGNARRCGAFTYGAEDHIIGVYGDGWYIVLRADGTAGYVSSDAFGTGMVDRVGGISQ